MIDMLIVLIAPEMFDTLTGQCTGTEVFLE